MHFDIIYITDIPIHSKIIDSEDYKNNPLKSLSKKFGGEYNK